MKTFSTFVLFVILGFGIYANTLGVPFLFDDNPRIRDNPYIRVTHLKFKEISNAVMKRPSVRNRPVSSISFALNYFFHQYNLRGYHIVNIMVHILTGFFLYLFVKATLSISTPQFYGGSAAKTLESSFIPFCTALVWLVHPAQTQSVTYIVQRMNSMAAMFYMLSFLLYLKGRICQAAFSAQGFKGKSSAKSKTHTFSGNRKTMIKLYFSGAVLAWLMGLGCKETVAALPFFVFLYEWYFFRDLNRDWFKHHIKYFFGVAIIIGLIGLIYMEFQPLEKIFSPQYVDHYGFTVSERLLTQPRVVTYYLSLILLPHPSRLNLDYDFPISHSLIDPATTLMSLAVILGLIGVACYTAKRERLISFCIFWYFGNLVIESSIIPLEMIYEHRVYLPSMFVCLLCAILAVRYIKPSRLLFAVFCIVVAVFSFWTYERNRVWGDPVVFWRDCVKKSPGKARPHNNLGNALTRRGLIDEAFKHYSEAMRLEPDYEKAYYNFGNALLRRGRIDDAIEKYIEALRIKPEYFEAHYNLGNALTRRGRLDDAIHHYLETLRIKPDFEEAHSNLGVALFQKGDVKGAVRHFREALRIRPDFAFAQKNLRIALDSQESLK